MNDAFQKMDEELEDQELCNEFDADFIQFNQNVQKAREWSSRQGLDHTPNVSLTNNNYQKYKKQGLNENKRGHIKPQDVKNINFGKNTDELRRNQAFMAQSSEVVEKSRQDKQQLEIQFNNRQYEQESFMGERMEALEQYIALMESKQFKQQMRAVRQNQMAQQLQAGALQLVQPGQQPDPQQIDQNPQGQIPRGRWNSQGVRNSNE